MTYLHEYKILDNNIKVEYVFSTVADKIKVIDMWVDDKPHSVDWMGPEARTRLMTRLEDDFTNRMCGTTNDESYIDSLLTTGFDEPYDHSIDTVDPDEPTDLPGVTVTDGFETTEEDEEMFDTMIDLDRDVPTEDEWLEEKVLTSMGV
tara:strand:- start:215 stop:658 length:444 start_codon:yes stop_codon:yes gene_type:complete